MNNIEKIKAEIERRIENYWSDGDVDSVVVSGELEELIDFIDSLPDERSSDDLEEELNKYIDDTFTVDDGVASIQREERHYYFEEDDMMAIARYFAEWGAKHLK